MSCKPDRPMTNAYDKYIWLIYHKSYICIHISQVNKHMFIAGVAWQFMIKVRIFYFLFFIDIWTIAVDCSKRSNTCVYGIHRIGYGNRLLVQCPYIVFNPTTLIVKQKVFWACMTVSVIKSADCILHKKSHLSCLWRTFTKSFEKITCHIQWKRER